jgi:hypothetical protein
VSDSATGHTLSMWVVTKNPSDYPGKFVARLNYITAEGRFSLAGEPLTADSLDALRAKLPLGLHRLPRWAHDDPVIVEVWL